MHLKKLLSSQCKFYTLWLDNTYDFPPFSPFRYIDLYKYFINCLCPVAPRCFWRNNSAFFIKMVSHFFYTELHNVLLVGSSFCWPVEWGFRKYKCAVAHVLLWFPPPVFLDFRSVFDELEAKGIAVLYRKCRWVSCLNFCFFLRVDSIRSVLSRSWSPYQSGRNAWMIVMSFLLALKVPFFRVYCDSLRSLLISLISYRR